MPPAEGRGPGPSETLESETLEQEATIILEEARTVLPGIQALFGFQLIAVFNQGFGEKLLQGEQELHLLAFVLVAAATALIMTPAAYHRQAERHQVSAYFVRVASRLLTSALLFLMLGIGLDAFLVARVIAGDVGIAAAIAIALTLAFFGLWFVFPRLKRATASRNAAERERKKAQNFA